MPGGNVWGPARYRKRVDRPEPTAMIGRIRARRNPYIDWVGLNGTMIRGGHEFCSVMVASATRAATYIAFVTVGSVSTTKPKVDAVRPGYERVIAKIALRH